MKIRCARCESMVSVKPATQMVSLRIKDKVIHMQVNGYICPQCGDFIFDANHVLDTAYNIYQAQTGIDPRFKAKVS